MEDLLFRVGVSSLLIRLSGTSSSSLKSETQIVQHYNNYNIQRTNISEKFLQAGYGTLSFRVPVCLMTNHKSKTSI